MSCGKWDEEIALWAGQDAVSPEFLGHLNGCRRCRAELAAMMAAMGQWTDWNPAGKQRPVRWWWGAAAAVVPLLLWVRWPQPVAVEHLVLAMPSGPAAPPAVERSVTVRPGKREQAVTVKIFTDDPDVVILLLGDAE